MSSKITRITTGALLVALSAAVGVQSYYLYRVHEKLDGRAAAAEPEVSGDTPSEAPKSISKRAADPLADPFDSFAWRPFREMEDMRGRIDELFADSLGRFDLDSAFPDAVVPRIDLAENDGEYVVHVDVPGADESSFEVSLEDRSLKVLCDSSEEIREEEPGKFYRRERRVGHFERRVALPGPVDSESLTSDYADGVLTIRVHKA